MLRHRISVRGIVRDRRQRDQKRRARSNRRRRQTDRRAPRRPRAMVAAGLVEAELVHPAVKPGGTSNGSSVNYTTPGDR